MADVLLRIANLNTQKAADAAKDLNVLADEQEKQISKKRGLREVQQELAKLRAQDTVTTSQLENLKSLMGQNSVGSDDLITQMINTAKGHNDELRLRSSDPNDTNVKQADKSCDALKVAIDGAVANVSDQEAMNQFRIQVGTGEMNNAETERASITKILYEHRKDLARNWAV